jgi:ribosomal protein S18 acetylase RimI-like enzyme
MSEPLALRLAVADDVAAVRRCVDAAYTPYIERIGRPPGPMTDDYPALIDRGAVFVAPEDDQSFAAVAVMWPEPDHLFIENLAVWPDRQGQGLGTRLIEACEAHARALGLDELRLYTHELMTENLEFYPHRGFTEVDRRTEDGFQRVYFRKQLGEPPEG